jgi:chaperonin cofactor prefoldin
MQKDYSSSDSIHEEHESDLRWERTQRRHSVFSAALILLAAGLVGAAWYGYRLLGRHDATLSSLPDVQKNVFSLGEQAKATDAKVDDWRSRQEELRSQLNKTRGELTARIDSARKQAGDASVALLERVRSEVGTQMDSVKTQLARLETSRESDREQVAKLQQELAQVQSQVQQQGQELASVHGQVEQHAASSDREMAAVKTTQQRDRGDFDAYTDKFAVKRVDFEVTKKHGTQVAPGISLQVDGTNVSYQRVDGSIWVIPERRTVFLRQLKTQEPVFLSSFPDGRTRELVITRVNKTGAVGYVLMPAQDGAPSRASVTSQAPAE